MAIQAQQKGAKKASFVNSIYTRLGSFRKQEDAGAPPRSYPGMSLAGRLFKKRHPQKEKHQPQLPYTRTNQ